MSFGYQVLGFGSGGEAAAGNDNGIFAYGSAPGITNISNLVSNTGVVSTDVTGVGTARSSVAGCEYGGDKGIFCYGGNPGNLSMSNLVSNTGVVGTDVTNSGISALRMRGGDVTMVVIKEYLVLVMGSLI